MTEIKEYVHFLFSRDLSPSDLKAAFGSKGLSFPLEGTAPCGTPFVVPTPFAFPREDTPCPCGDAACWFLRWRD